MIFSATNLDGITKIKKRSPQSMLIGNAKGARACFMVPIEMIVFTSPSFGFGRIVNVDTKSNKRKEKRRILSKIVVLTRRSRSISSSYQSLINEDHSSCEAELFNSFFKS